LKYGDHPIFGTDRDPSWATRPETIRHVEAYVGSRFALDLAATDLTSVAGRYLGPGSAIASDAFAVDWATLHGEGGPSWLSPPWSRMCLQCPGGRWQTSRGNRPGCSDQGHTSRTKVHWLERAARLGTSETCRLHPLVMAIPHTPGAWHYVRHVLGLDTHSMERSPGGRAAAVIDCGRMRYDRILPDGTRQTGDAPGFSTAVVVYRGPSEQTERLWMDRGTGQVVRL